MSNNMHVYMCNVGICMNSIVFTCIEFALSVQQYAPVYIVYTLESTYFYHTHALHLLCTCPAHALHMLPLQYI